MKVSTGTVPADDCFSLKPIVEYSGVGNLGLQFSQPIVDYSGAVNLGLQFSKPNVCIQELPTWDFVMRREGLEAAPGAEALRRVK